MRYTAGYQSLLAESVRWPNACCSRAASRYSFLPRTKLSGMCPYALHVALALTTLHPACLHEYSRLAVAPHVFFCFSLETVISLSSACRSHPPTFLFLLASAREPPRDSPSTLGPRWLAAKHELRPLDIGKNGERASGAENWDSNLGMDLLLWKTRLVFSLVWAPNHASPSIHKQHTWLLRRERVAFTHVRVTRRI